MRFGRKVVAAEKGKGGRWLTRADRSWHGTHEDKLLLVAIVDKKRLS